MIFTIIYVLVVLTTLGLMTLCMFEKIERETMILGMMMNIITIGITTYTKVTYYP